jgi:hypothetical protein
MLRIEAVLDSGYSILDEISRLDGFISPFNFEFLASPSDLCNTRAIRCFDIRQVLIIRENTHFSLHRDPRCRLHTRVWVIAYYFVFTRN